MDERKADIVIADDHKLFRKGVRALLEDFDFIGKIYEAANGVELLELLNQADPLPDLILLDIQMPVMDGIEALKKIRKEFPGQKVVILTMEDDKQFILHLIMEGVNGYLLKNTEPEELEIAIRKLLINDFYFPAEMSQLVLKSARKGIKGLADLPQFSEKEIEILEYICKEYTASEIAEQLHLSVRTIEGYRSRLLDKAGAKNIAGLVMYAFKNKLVII